jgi:hypothetical protein
MAKYTRGEFLGLAGLAAGAVVTGVRGGAAAADDAREAELAVLNGRVFTVE